MAPESETVVVLMHKLEFVEEKLTQYMSDNNVRLDQLIDLTKQIAAMSERQSRHNDALIDLRDRVSNENQTTRDAITRIHTRLDSQKDSFTKENDKLEEKIDGVSADFHKWLNRGWGAWAVAIMIFGTAQTVVFKLVDSIEKDRAKNSESIDYILKMNALNDQKLKTLEKNQEDLDRGQRKIADGQRELENIILRKK